MAKSSHKPVGSVYMLYDEINHLIINENCDSQRRMVWRMLNLALIFFSLTLMLASSRWCWNKFFKNQTKDRIGETPYHGSMGSPMV